MGKVPDCNLPLLINVCDKRSAVVDAEIENTVLIGSLESNTKDGGVGGLRDGGEVETVEGRQHAELELDVVVRSGDEGDEAVVVPLGDFNLEVLYCC